jgi:hypothetical protein
MSGTLFNPMKSGLRKRLQGIFMRLLSKSLDNPHQSSSFPLLLKILLREKEGRKHQNDFSLGGGEFLHFPPNLFFV